MAGSSFWRGLAPVWLRVLAGLLILPFLWVGFELLLAGLLVRVLPDSLMVLLADNFVVLPVLAILVAGIIATLLVRKSSTRRAAGLSSLAVLVYSMESLTKIGGRLPQDTFDGLPAEPPQADSPGGENAELPPQSMQPEAPRDDPPASDGYHYEVPPAGGANGGGGQMAQPGAGAPGPDLGAPSGGGGQPLDGQIAGEAPLKPPLPEPSLDAPLPQPSLDAPLQRPAIPGSAQIDGATDGAAGVPSDGAGQLPEFPWPPPSASASYVLPDRLFTAYRTVGEVTSSILGALEQNGYVERSFYRTPPGGVALVTRLERINTDGSPSAEAERWPAAAQPHQSARSLFDFLQGLFFVDPGHYRVIVFVLQDLPFSQSAETITAQQAHAWLVMGANVLPSEIAALPFSGGHVTVLIYEFASDGSKVQVVTSELTGKQHLERAGVLAILDKVQ